MARIGWAQVGLGVLGGAVAAAVLVRNSQRRAKFHGKVVLITGGSRGFGLEIARQFGLAGAHLVLVARKADELDRARGWLESENAITNGQTIHTVVGDVASEQDARRAVEETLQRYGRLDVLVNNAGVITIAPFQDLPLQAFHESMQINFYGALHFIQAGLPHLLETKGQIVNIASFGGKVAVPHMMSYVASKFALVGLSEGLNAELRSSGVRVTTVNPGVMRTGSHVQAEFAGDAQAEYEWFRSGAFLPGFSVSARSAARQVLNAAADGRAEIDISPQAWLGARMNGLAPSLTARLAGLANQLLLPSPNGNRNIRRGGELQQPTLAPVAAWSEHLQQRANQVPEAA